MEEVLCNLSDILGDISEDICAICSGAIHGRFKKIPLEISGTPSGCFCEGILGESVYLFQKKYLIIC